MAKLALTSFIDSGSPAMSRAGDYAGKTRIDIVYEKIDKQLPFTIGPKEGGEKVYGVSFTSKSGNKPTVNNWPYLLIYSKNQDYKSAKDLETLPITRFFKDKDFGGGGRGSGGGQPQTDITESGQAYYMSLIFNVVKRELHCADATPANWKLAIPYVDATTSFQDFLDKGPEDWIEEDVYIKTANIVYKKYGAKFAQSRGKVYCHRGSKFMNNLYKAKKAAHVLDRTEDKLAPGSFNNDKWNPGDIWLSTFKKTEEPLEPCRNFNDLKKCVLDFSGEGNLPATSLLGVSLKKPAAKARIIEYNKWTDPIKRAHNKDGSVPYSGFTFGKKGDFFSSNDVYIQFANQEMQMRGSNTTRSWQGNLLGATAYGGKCGGGNLQFYMSQQGRSITYDGIKKSSWSEMPANSVDMKKFYELYATYLTKQNIPGAKNYVPLKYTEFETAVKEKNNVNAFIFNKNMGLMLVNQLETLPKIKQNAFCTEVVRYAASNTDLSTYFIKVE